MANSLVVAAPGTLSAAAATTPRLLHAFPSVTPTRRFVANQVAQAIGTPVIAWADLTGGLTLSAATTPTSPLLDRVNNVYGIKLDGVDDIYGSGSNTLTDTVYTIVMIARMVTVATNKALLNFRGSVVATDSASQFRLFGTAAVKPGSAPVADTGLHFLAAVMNGASSIMRVDSFTASGDPGSPSTGANQLATSSSANTSLTEIAYFNSALTDVQLQAIRTGLKLVYPTLP